MNTRIGGANAAKQNWSFSGKICDKHSRPLSSIPITTGLLHMYWHAYYILSAFICYAIFAGIAFICLRCVLLCVNVMMTRSANMAASCKSATHTCNVMATSAATVCSKLTDHIASNRGASMWRISECQNRGALCARMLESCENTVSFALRSSVE